MAMTTTTETKPTAGAMRAANAINMSEGDVYFEDDMEEWAEIIDFETSAPEMFVAIAKLVCPDCNHELQHHADKHGCEIERGDGYRHAEFEEALGPCGCSDDDLRDDYPDFVRALEAFRKARGR